MLAVGIVMSWSEWTEQIYLTYIAILCGYRGLEGSGQQRISVAERSPGTKVDGLSLADISGSGPRVSNSC
jgi:hypothetical protein